MDWSDSDPIFYLYHASFRLLELDLKLNDRMRSLMQDDHFAQFLSDVLTSSVGNLCTLDGTVLLDGVGDHLRGLVVDLRGKGETFHQFAGGIVDYPIKCDAKQIREELAAVGWRAPTGMELIKLSERNELSRNPEVSREIGSWLK